MLNGFLLSDSVQRVFLSAETGGEGDVRGAAGAPGMWGGEAARRPGLAEINADSR